jgi:hypothetical protein
MRKTMLIVASTLGLVLGASQLATAAPAASGATMNTAIDALSPTANVGYHYRRHYGGHHYGGHHYSRRHHYNYT